MATRFHCRSEAFRGKLSAIMRPTVQAGRSIVAGGRGAPGSRRPLAATIRPSLQTLSVRALSDAVVTFFDAADAQTRAFSASSGVACPSGCGACCTRAGGIEARVAEMLPAAFALLGAGGDEAEDAYARAEADPDGLCAFFLPESPGSTQRGKCAHYAVRPGVCRLFGFATNDDKHGRPRLSTCAILRTDVWSARVDGGELRAPSMTSVGAAIEELAGALTGLGERMPINRALQAALTRAAYAAPLPSMELQSEGTPFSEMPR